MIAEILERPLLRGWLHTLTFLAAIPAGVVLVLIADGAAARAAVAIYASAILLGFGTSAAYHRMARSPRARRLMAKADRSMIYVLITGTYVPLCLIALPTPWGIPLLASVAAGGLLGIVLVVTDTAWGRTLSLVLYLVTGWAALVATPALLNHLTSAQLALILAGGVLYTAGFPVLVRNRPDPWPRVFGYHELWHVFTVAAAVAQFLAVVSIAS